MSLAYRMEGLTREEMAAEDPFGGRGVFLPAPELDGAAMLARLGHGVPAIAWDGIGLWADPGSSEAGAAGLLASWHEGERLDP